MLTAIKIIITINFLVVITEGQNTIPASVFDGNFAGSGISIGFCDCEAGYLSTENDCVLDSSASFLDVSTNGPVPKRLPTTSFNWTVGKPVCGKGKSLYLFPKEAFLILNNGWLVLKEFGLTYPHDHFCINFLKRSNATVLTSEVCVLNTLHRCSTKGIDENEVDIKPESEIPVNFGSISAGFNWRRASVIDLKCGDSFQEKKLELTDHGIKFVHTRKGTLLEIITNDGFTEIYDNGQFCIEVQSSEPLLRLCTKFEKSEFALRKCCHEQQIYDLKYGKCVRHQKSLDPLNRMLKYFKSILQENSQLQNRSYSFIKKFGFPACDYALQDIGAKNSKTTEFSHLLSDKDVCFETIQTTSNLTVHHSTVAAVCPDHCPWVSILKAVAMGISCLCLISTLFLHLRVPGLSSSLFARCLLSEISALFLSFLLSVTAFSLHGLIVGSLVCEAMGFANHLSVLASFFWLSVICYDRLRNIRREFTVFSTKAQFTIYSVVCWGMATVMASAAVIADHWPTSGSVIRPQTALNCFPGSDNVSRWLYVYGPIAVLLSFNLGVFLYVSWRICLLYSTMTGVMGGGMCEGERSRWRAERKERIVTYLKHFIVMGLGWLAEVISFEFSDCSLWLVTDMFNGMRGVFIFWIFLCDKKTKLSQYMSVCPSRTVTKATSSGTTETHETTLTQISASM